MSELLVQLRRLFTDRYDVLKRQLAYRLGSQDLADDVLHETYVKLAGRPVGEAMRSPQSYVIRTAMNLAIDRIRADGRLLGGEEIDQLLAPDEQAPDPAAGAIARIDLEAVARAMELMPARRRQLFFAARVEGVPQRELAERYGISLRLVELEIRRAYEFCVEQMRGEEEGAS